MAAGLAGMILCGGRSTRMNGIDKAAIEYNGKPATLLLREVLEPFCSQVVLGNRNDQEALPGHSGQEQLHDHYPDSGPLGAIVSGLESFPGSALLVLGCDMPFVMAQEIEELLEARDPEKAATVFQDPSGRLQPLAAVYEPAFLPILKKNLEAGRLSPSRILAENPVQSVTPSNPSALANINTPDDLNS